MGKHRKLGAEEIVEAESLYYDGWTLPAIADLYGASVTAVWNNLKKAGVEMRQPGLRPVAEGESTPIRKGKCNICGVEFEYPFLVHPRSRCDKHRAAPLDPDYHKKWLARAAASE